jgi:TPR repeat protein
MIAHPVTWVILVLFLLISTTHADYQSGLDAYNQARYSTALKEWKAVIATPPGAVSPATYAETNYAIGMLYWMGQGVAADYHEAFKWLHKAAEMGHAGAQAKLGYLYTQGLAVEQSYATAFDWFDRAAKQGDVDAQYNLGIFYLNGWGTGEDKTMAAQYLAAASAQGDKAAEEALQVVLPALGLGVSASENVSVSSGESLIQPASWILAQDPQYYTIQVIGLRSQQTLENLIRGYDYMAPFATYTLQLNTGPLHLLIQGVYPNMESARKARDNFPKAIQKPQEVWIRQFGKVQELIRSTK